ncbi:RNA and export factor binding protein, putative [Theileria annulata]|uniref:RNA and export factor binding protein, putative n=1 Tax=Theileria annulata TaxID=5874 RepID=Q4UDD2_THEAN|nr:RNA and export factor binding protein, putative [Theileria annulata]CAI74907.1 RNA and export factor binding protein, putative [Theileria annulata]|eukprot:XP_952639.1 RNA and export factor binding protein, putative [Theileria annulata]
MDVDPSVTTANKLDMSLDDLGKAMKSRKVKNGRNFKGFSRRNRTSQPRSRRSFFRGSRRFGDRPEPFRRRRRETKYIVRVSNLDHSVMKEDLMELFSSVGDVVKVWVDYDNTDRSKGTGGCIYKFTDDAKKAISKFNGTVIEGKAVEMYGEVFNRERRPFLPRERFGLRTSRFSRPRGQRRNFKKTPW